MHYGKLFCFLGLSAIVVLEAGLPALSQESDSQSPLEVLLTTPSPESPSPTSDPAICASDSDDPESKRIELTYYRNAGNVVALLNQLLPTTQGCANLLPVNELTPGSGVGRGGGNIILLYGAENYIDRASRLIAPLDLPLPGVNLQLWGVQISSGKPDKLAEVMNGVREQINLTQQLVRETFNIFQQEAQRTLRGRRVDRDTSTIHQRAIEDELGLPGLDIEFFDIAKKLGYQEALTPPRRLSILDVFLVGTAAENPLSYYKNLYAAIVKGEIDLKTGRFKASDARYQEYFDAMRETGRPPFERIFRSRGLNPRCKITHLDDNKCELWDWEEIFLGSVESFENTRRAITLEFAFQYADFVSNPTRFDAAELQRTSEALNSGVQQFTNLIQQDIEDLFVRPTLRNIQDRVADSRSVSFAQVGRTTITTLSGVETVINSSSTSAFEIPQSSSFEELLQRAEAIEQLVSPFIPTAILPDVGEVPIASAGPIPISQLVGLVVALTDQQTTPVSLETGTNLRFTPGVLRDLNSAELNIHLTVTDPSFTPTQGEGTVNISRVGRQEVQTSVYTQALDFFDLSTFTSQATLEGGRFYFPVVGQLWRAIFGSIPGLGELFSFPRSPQNVLHENLLLTNSFITPTSLGIGLLYPIEDTSIYQGMEFCKRKIELLTYLRDDLDPLIERNFLYENSLQPLSFEDLNAQDRERCETSE